MKLIIICAFAKIAFITASISLICFMFDVIQGVWGERLIQKLEGDLYGLRAFVAREIPQIFVVYFCFVFL